jgi:hypothetical protein
VIYKFVRCWGPFLCKSMESILKTIIDIKIQWKIQSRVAITASVCWGMGIRNPSYCVPWFSLGSKKLIKCLYNLYSKSPLKYRGTSKYKREKCMLKWSSCVFTLGTLPAVIFIHVHQVDALSMQTVAIHVRATLCYWHLSHTWIVFHLNCEGNGNLNVFYCILGLCGHQPSFHNSDHWATSAKQVRCQSVKGNFQEEGVP